MEGMFGRVLDFKIARRFLRECKVTDMEATRNHVKCENSVVLQMNSSVISNEYELMCMC